MPQSTPQPTGTQQLSAGNAYRSKSSPSYSRNLLKIRMPVAVTLATTKCQVGQILSIVPGEIIQFSKLCDESLTLIVGNQPVAQGEAVKVGDKFGLRITSMTLPEERFSRIEKRATAAESDDQ